MVTKYIHIACGHSPSPGFGFSVRCVQEYSKEALGFFYDSLFDMLE